MKTKFHSKTLNRKRPLRTLYVYREIKPHDSSLTLYHFITVYMYIQGDIFDDSVLELAIAA